MGIKKEKDDYLEAIEESLFGYDPSMVGTVIEELSRSLDENALKIASSKGKVKPTKEDMISAISASGDLSEVKKRYHTQLRGGNDKFIASYLYFNIAIGSLLLLSLFVLYYYGEDLKRWDSIYDLGALRIYHWGAIVLQSIGGFSILFLSYLCLRKRILIKRYAIPLTAIALIMGIFQFVFLINYIRYVEYRDGPYINWHFLTYTTIFGFCLLIELLGPWRVISIASHDRSKKSVKKDHIPSMFWLFFTITLVIASTMIGSGLNDTSHWDLSWKELFSTEEIGRDTNATIEYWELYEGREDDSMIKIRYSLDGEEVSGFFDIDGRYTYDWIWENTDVNASFLCWWDYGHSIRGYANREAISYGPYRGMEFSITHPERIEDWSQDPEVLKDTGRALIATDDSEVLAIMDEYGTDHILINHRDAYSIQYAFFYVAGVDPGGQIRDWTELPPELSERAKQSFVYRAWVGEEIDGLELVHSDILYKIYRKI